MIPITPAHKENFANFILPVIETTFPMQTIPNQTQIQTSTLEPYNIRLTGPGPIIGSRVAEIEGATLNYLCGLAGKKSEVAQYVAALNTGNEGGFLGDLFAAIEPLANAIPVAGNIITGVGRVVQATGL